MKLNNRGLSLVEVIVYMVVSVFVIGYIFSALTGVSKSFHHEKNKAHIQMTGQGAINMLARDIAGTGFKYFMDTFTVNDTVVFETRLLEGTYLRSVLNEFPNGKSSDEYDASFMVEAGDYFDELEIFKAKMKDAHTLDTVQRISFIIDNGRLKRKNGSYLRFVKDWDPDSETSKKVDICHVPPGNPENAHTISVSINAVGTHLDHHDDYLGGCIADYNGPSLVNENKWSYDTEYISLLEGVVALKFNFSEDFVTWENTPTNPELVNYVRIYLLLKSEREGTVVNSSVFTLGVNDEGNTVYYTVPEGNKHFYRLYERTVEIPSNGCL